MIRQLITMMLSRRQRLAFTVPEFAHAHKDLILIVADPKTDEIYVSYKNHHVRGAIKSVKGGKQKTLKKLLSESQFSEGLDGLMVAILDAFKVNLRLPAANQFGQCLDGALFNISKSLRKKPSTHAAPAAALPGQPAGAFGRP